MEGLIIIGLLVWGIYAMMGGGCEHDYRGHRAEMYKYSTHKCRECDKAERCKGYFNVSSSEWECETCGQCLSHMKHLR